VPRPLLWLLALLTVLMATELRPSHGEPRIMVVVPFSSGSDANATPRPGPAIVQATSCRIAAVRIVGRPITTLSAERATRMSA
jgi:hypothetical protein